MPTKSMSAASAEGLHKDNDDDPPDEEASITGQALSGDGDDKYCCVSKSLCGVLEREKIIVLNCLGLIYGSNDNNSRANAVFI